MKNLIVRLPDDLHKTLKRIALDQDTSLQQIAIKLFEEFVAKQDNKKPKK